MDTPNNSNEEELREDLSNYNSKVYNKPSVTVDVCICRFFNNELQVLLVKRKNHPFKDKWAIPGGFLDIRDENDLESQESLEDSAKRELKEETGLDGIFIEQLKTYGNPTRDPRTRVITVAYYALVPNNVLETKVIEAGSDAKEVAWFPLKNMTEDLAFDHNDILKELFNRLSGKIIYAPLAFELLGPKFTWQELKSIYEYLLDKKLLEPNFRRKIKSMYMISTVPDEIYKPKTGRPAKLLKFDGIIEQGF